ncbi:uncharacterized protein YjdB [Paenibacillus endophyticus]|uniref:Uncharacterized protein YjdB n=1 Tax=Paenibacillus endophyticus TaxID=1294268 RepID=A0A7W5C3U1_9BACL|nr:S-layer homology domain-containing protein [Paenibacillus endophyticus]MBB3150493.1 uncharacterized protein YjdB [Paenibacillus endophyticus]
MLRSMITKKRMGRFLMKLTMVLMSIILVVLPTFTPNNVYAADAAAENVTVYAADALQQPFYGFGTQFDPYVGSNRIISPLSDEQWDQVMTRAEYMRMGFSRLALACNAFSPTLTVGEYDWNTDEMKQIYKILDRLKADGTTVLLSSWRMDYENDTVSNNSSEKYVDLIVDALDYLINTKGYTNIKYYQHVNEPKTNKISWEGYKQAVVWLKDKIADRNLPVALMATGNQPGTGLYDSKNQLELAPYLGAYDVHFYPSQASIANASNSVVATRMKELSDSPKPLFISEAGSFDNVTSDDHQPNVRNYWYSLHQVDYAMQAVFQGVSGISAWIMDDAMHGKLWGMWDIFNSPNPRPWFYSYSLLSRYVEQGSTLYQPEAGNDRTTRMLVSSKAVDDGTKNWTIAAVNRGTESREFTVRIPGVASATWDLYKYTQDYHPTDANALPVKDSEITNVDMTNTGVTITVPANGFVLLTTSDQSPVDGVPTEGVVKLPIFADFNNHTTGSAPIGWELQGDHVTIEDMPSAANKSMRVSGDSGAGVNGAAYHFISQSAKIVEEFDIKVDQTDQRVNAGILKSGADTATEVYFDKDGNLCYGDSSSGTIIMPYNAHTWYHVKIVADAATGKFDVYVNDMVIPKVHQASFKTSSSFIDHVEYNVPEESNAKFNVDNVRIYRLLAMDSFDEQSTGSAPAGWEVVGDQIKVEEMPSTSDKILKIDGKATTGADTAAIRFEAHNKRIVMGFDIKLDSKARVQSGYMYDEDIPAVVLYFDSDGTIRYYYGDRSRVLASSFQVNTWYSFKLVIDPSTNLFDIYLNDMNKPAVTNVPFRSSAFSLDRILFGAPENSQAIFNLNNVYAYTEAQMPSADANLKHIEFGTGTISPAFQTDTMDYQLIVNKGTESVSITPSPSSPYAMVSVDGIALSSDTASPRIPIAFGEDRNFTIEVKAQDGITTKQYEFTVIESDNPVVEVENVTLNKEALSLKVGDSETLTATITPSEATNKQATWTSSHSDVASVSETGEITAVSVGTATITVTTLDGGYTAECLVTVTDATGEGYAVAIENGEGSGSYAPGDIVTIKAQIAPDGQTFDKWTADKSSVVFENAGAIETTFVMPEESVTVTATYKATTRPMWPTGAQLLASNVGKTSLMLSWTAASGNTDVTSYKVYKNGIEFMTLPVEITNYQVGGLSSDKAYSFKVEAGDAADNWSVDGPSVTVTTEASSSGGGWTPPPTPTPTPTPTEPVNPTEPETPKVDLSDITDHWARAAISKSVELGFVNGYENGTFKPNATITRGEYATMLARALKLELGDSGFSFADQDQTPIWAQPFIQAIADAGFISGYEDGSFRTNNGVTRSELVVILVRAMGLEINPNASLAFDDAEQIPEWAKPYVATAAEAGFIKGYGNGKFNPNGTSTRAEAVTLILAMLDHLK